MICHRLRIYPKRIELFELRVRLIKLGYLVEAERLGDYTDMSLESIESSIRIIRKKMNLKSGAKEGESEGQTVQQKDETLTALEVVSELERKNREGFYGQITDILENNKSKAAIGNSITIAVERLVKEIMSCVIPSKCPH